MAAPWQLFAKALGGSSHEGSSSEAPAPPVPVQQRAEVPQPVQAEQASPRTSVPATPPQVNQWWSLDSVGQQTEDVRERVDMLMERLDDLKSLSEEFDQIVQPINGFVQQHTHARAKLVEVQTLLSREIESGRQVRTELISLQDTHAKVGDEFANAVAHGQKQTSLLNDQDALISDLRLRIEDKTGSLHNLEQVLAAETDRARTLASENQARRSEIENLDAVRTRLEREVQDAYDAIGRYESENMRLQNMADGFAQRFGNLKGQLSELEPQVQAGREQISALQAKLLVEQTGRQKAEATREAERSAQGLEITSLQMKIEGLNAHVETTDRILANTRDQLRDKADALRTVEKAIKDIEMEKAALDRKIESMQDSQQRQTTQVQDFQKQNSDLQARCDMLTKALAAKDAVVEGANRKANTLSSRLDLLTARAEQERINLEGTNRRLLEELQAEKAERSLAQGALDIARSSRTKLLSQYSALKRQHAGAPAGPAEDGGIEADQGRSDFSNVRAFKGGEREAE